MRMTIIEAVAEETGLDSEVVNTIIESFTKQLHKRSYEHDASTSYYDYLTSGLGVDVSYNTLYHLLGMLTVYLDRSGAPDLAKVSILHSLELMKPRDEWQQYIEEIENWIKGY